jgi:hypothetical protein
MPRDLIEAGDAAKTRHCSNSIASTTIDGTLSNWCTIRPLSMSGTSPPVPR